VGGFVKGVKSLVEELENILLQFEQLQQSLHEEEAASSEMSAVTSGRDPPSPRSEMTESSWL
jgi:hypothetical protein